MENEHIQIIEVNRNTRRQEERNLLRAVFLESSMKRDHHVLMPEIVDSFSRLESKARNTHGLDLDSKSAFSIGYSAIDTENDVKTIADNFGIDSQTVTRLKNDFIAAMSFVSTEVLDYKIPITLTSKQFERMQRTRDLYYESKNLLSRLEDEDVQALLAGIPHVDFILREYSKGLGLNNLYRKSEIDLPTSRVGDINKELNAFILGKADNPRGIRKTASTLLFHFWNSGTEMFITKDEEFNSFASVLWHLGNSDALKPYEKFIEIVGIEKPKLRHTLRKTVQYLLEGKKKSALPKLLGVKNTFSDGHNEAIISEALTFTEKLLANKVRNLDDINLLANVNPDNLIWCVLKKFQSIK